MNCIHQTIEAINQRISKLTQVREALVALEPEFISLPISAKPTPTPQPATAATRKVRAAVAKAPPKRGPYKKKAVTLSDVVTAAHEAGAKLTVSLKPSSPAGAPATFAGAIKRLVRESAKALTITEIFSTISTNWPSLADGKDGNNVMVNLSYWASQGKCEKLGRGALATFKVLDAEYFQETQE